MARRIGAFVLISCSVLLALLGCRASEEEKPEPRLYVELNGQKEFYGMKPASYVVSGGGAYGVGETGTTALEGVEYRGQWYYSGKLEDGPKPENLLMGVYGRAEPGTEILRELIIETNVKTKIVLQHCEAWDVRLRRDNQVITDEHWFEPGKYVIEIRPQQ